MPNLDKVVHNDDLNAVTEMPPTMSDAYIDSVEADKAVEDIIKPAEEIIKEKPFLGAEKQPTPKEPEEAKITLDEALFDYFEVGDDDWEDAAWHDTADQEEEEDIPEDILRDYIDSIEVEEEAIEECNQTELTEDAHNKPDCYDNLLGYYHEVIYNSIPIIQETEEAVPGYDGDWCREDMDPQVDKAIDQLAKALANAAVYYYQGPAEVDWSDETDVEFDENLNKKNQKYNLNESDLAAKDLGSYKDQLKIIRQIDKAIPYSLRYKEANFIEDDGYTYLYWVAQEPFTKSELEHFQDSVNDILDRYYDFDMVSQIKLTVRDISKGYKTDKLNNRLISIDRYGYIENDDWYWKKYSDYLDENLNEEDKSKLAWDELGTEEAEEVDLWTLVYNTLSKERDLGASNSIKKYITPQLSLKQRYDPINADSEGNIIVYGETEEEFNPAKEVADFHNLKYKIKESPKNWVMRHPEQKYSFTIIIPEDQLNRKLELRNPDVKRGRPKKIKKDE